MLELNIDCSPSGTTNEFDFKVSPGGGFVNVNNAAGTITKVSDSHLKLTVECNPKVLCLINDYLNPDTACPVTFTLDTKTYTYSPTPLILTGYLL